MDDLHTISEAEYARRFRDPTFGFSLAHAIGARHTLPHPLTRKVEGSNLVFRAGDGRWLKVIPPFDVETFDAELQVTRAVAGKTPVPVPTILHAGELEGWRYLISADLPGMQIQHVMAEFSAADFETVAVELGQFMACLHTIRVPEFARATRAPFGPWSAYLDRGVSDAERIHAARGNAPEWVRQISELLDQQRPRLLRLGPPVLVHADLTPEHIILREGNGRWHLCGILDLADAMIAPAELDAVVPMLDLFRGRRHIQRRLLQETGIECPAPGESFSAQFMAIALLHPFTFVHDWFEPEIKNGCTRLDEIARLVLPD
jgi:hygromycin-B 7''-O-kinase